MKWRTAHLLAMLVASIATTELSFARESLDSGKSLLTEVKFRLSNDYLIVAPVKVNGHGPYDMVIDTGSGFSFIDTETASEIGLKEIDSVDVYALFGVDRVKTSVADITFAGREFERTSIAIQDLAAFRRIDRNIRGILGWNVLWKFNFLIDYREHRLEIHDGSPLPEIKEKATPYVRKAGVVLVPAAIPDLLGRKMQLILDSGARSVLLYSNLLPPTVDLGEYEFRGSTVTTAKVHTVHVPMMGIGTNVLSQVTVGLLLGGKDQYSHSADGVLPLSLFRSVYFNNSEGYIVLNPHLRKK